MRLFKTYGKFFFISVAEGINKGGDIVYNKEEERGDMAVKTTRIHHRSVKRGDLGSSFLYFSKPSLSPSLSKPSIPSVKPSSLSSLDITLEEKQILRSLRQRNKKEKNTLSSSFSTHLDFESANQET